MKRKRDETIDEERQKTKDTETARLRAVWKRGDGSLHIAQPGSTGIPEVDNALARHFAKALLALLAPALTELRASVVMALGSTGTSPRTPLPAPSPLEANSECNASLPQRCACSSDNQAVPSEFTPGASPPPRLPVPVGAGAANHASSTGAGQTTLVCVPGLVMEEGTARLVAALSLQGELFDACRVVMERGPSAAVLTAAEKEQRAERPTVASVVTGQAEAGKVAHAVSLTRTMRDGSLSSASVCADRADVCRRSLATALLFPTSYTPVMTLTLTPNATASATATASAEVFAQLAPHFVRGVVVRACELLAELFGLSPTSGDEGEEEVDTSGYGMSGAQPLQLCPMRRSTTCERSFEDVAKQGRVGVDAAGRTPSGGAQGTHRKRERRGGSSPPLTNNSPAVTKATAAVQTVSDWVAVVWAPDHLHSDGVSQVSQLSGRQQAHCRAADPTVKVRRVPLVPGVVKGAAIRDAVVSPEAIDSTDAATTAITPMAVGTIAGDGAVGQTEAPRRTAALVNRACNEVCLLAAHITSGTGKELAPIASPSVGCAGADAEGMKKRREERDGEGALAMRSSTPPRRNDAHLLSGAHPGEAYCMTPVVRWLPLHGPLQPFDLPLASLIPCIIGRCLPLQQHQNQCTGNQPKALARFDRTTAAALAEVGTVLAAVDRVFAARTMVDESAWRYGRNRLSLVAESTVYLVRTAEMEDDGGTQETDTLDNDEDERQEHESGMTDLPLYREPSVESDAETLCNLVCDVPACVPPPTQVPTAGTEAVASAASTCRWLDRSTQSRFRPVARYMHETGLLYNTRGEPFALDVEAEPRW